MPGLIVPQQDRKSPYASTWLRRAPWSIRYGYARLLAYSVMVLLMAPLAMAHEASTLLNNSPGASSKTTNIASQSSNPAILEIGTATINSSADAIHSGTAPTPVLMVLGDSLSAGYGFDPAQGWVAMLDEWLQQRSARYKAVNISISGETTGGGLDRLPAALSRWKPELVIVALGGNDGLRATPLSLVEDNLRKIIALCRAQDAGVILAGMHIPPNYGPRYTEAFFAIYGRLAQEHRLPLIPFLLEGVATNPALMQADGLHPAASAQALIANNVKSVLGRVLAE